MILFNKTNNKNSFTFIKFHIEEFFEKFYPGITKNLLLKSIEFAKIYMKIINSDIKLYYTPAKSCHTLQQSFD